MHVRQQVREGVVALLAGLATTGANVYDSRAYEIEETNFPFWTVHTPESESERSAVDVTRHDLAVVLTGGVRELTGLAAQQKLDLMAEEAETALSRSAVTAAIAGVRGWNLVGAEFAQVPDESDRIYGYVELAFAATFFTQDGAPGAFN